MVINYTIYEEFLSYEQGSGHRQVRIALAMPECLTVHSGPR